MKTDLVQVLVGTAPWRVWKGFGSFLLADFGRKCRTKDGEFNGEYLLWIEMAFWRIRKEGKELANAESSDSVIAKACRILTAKKLEEVQLAFHIRKKRTLHAAHFRFAGNHVIDVWQYDRRQAQSIFAVFSPTHVLSFSSDGSLTTKRMKTPRTGKSTLPRVPLGT